MSLLREQSEKVEELYIKHSKQMVQIAYRHVGDEGLAKELVHEVFIRAMSKANVNDFCEHPNPFGWLLKALDNVIRNEQDLAYHKQEVPLEDIQEYLSTSSVDPALPMSALLPEGLTEEERKLILLRFEDNLSFAELAERLGIKEAACRKRVSRAVHKCRMLLIEEASGV